MIETETYPERVDELRMDKRRGRRTKRSDQGCGGGGGRRG